MLKRIITSLSLWISLEILKIKGNFTNESLLGAPATVLQYFPGALFINILIIY